MKRGDLIQAKGDLAPSVHGAFGVVIKKNDALCAPFDDVYDVLWNDGTVTPHWESDLEEVINETR